MRFYCAEKYVDLSFKFIYYRCKSLNCTAFVVDFARNICYSVQVKSEELIPETNATLFHQICIHKGKD